MKKSLIALSVLSVFLILPLVVLAQPGGGITLDSLISAVKSAAWKIFGIIAIICFVMAAILFLSSRGDPEKLTSARSAFIWGIAGVVVGILAFSIITFVQALL